MSFSLSNAFSFVASYVWTPPEEAGCPAVAEQQPPRNVPADAVLACGVVGPGRNLPISAEMFREGKVNLKSPEIVQNLQRSCKVTEACLAKTNLKKVGFPDLNKKKLIEYPCCNPLFIELRQRLSQSASKTPLRT